MVDEDPEDLTIDEVGVGEIDKRVRRQDASRGEQVLQGVGAAEAVLAGQCDHAAGLGLLEIESPCGCLD